MIEILNYYDYYIYSKEKNYLYVIGTVPIYYIVRIIILIIMTNNIRLIWTLLIIFCIVVVTLI